MMINSSVLILLLSFIGVFFIPSVSYSFPLLENEMNAKNSLFDCVKYYEDRASVTTFETSLNDPLFRQMLFSNACELGFEDSGKYTHILSEQEQIDYFKFAISKTMQIFLTPLLN